eukprot:g7529.t1
MSDYEPKGELIAMPGIGGMECYVSWPAGGATCAVIVFQDIFGIHSGRHKQFCDMLAEKGYGALAPDLTARHSIVSEPPQYGCSLWCFCSLLCGVCCGGLGRAQRALSWESSMRDIVLGNVVPLARQKGATRMAAVGFCFGSYGAMHCGTVPETFACVASFHPSTEHFCKAAGEDDLELCRRIRAPQLVVATSMESARWKPGGAAQAACEEPGAGGSARAGSTWVLEQKQRHGFMMRGDTSNAETLATIRRHMCRLFGFLEANMKA